MSGMTRTITIAPVRKTLRVKAGQVHAFEVFTSGIGQWWPRNHSIGDAPVKAVVMETHLGGRWYQLCEDGSEAVIGSVQVWEPPQRFVVSWDISCHWKADTTRLGSEVEVRFIADGANATRVELEHRKFERMGAEPGTKMRNAVDGGWPKILEFFRVRAEGA
jgi:uncharacterized protein YndB with AHSA1/START domain